MSASKSSKIKSCRHSTLLVLYYLGLTLGALVTFLMIVLPVLVIGHSVKWLANKMGRGPEARIILLDTPVEGQIPNPRTDCQ